MLVRHDVDRPAWASSASSESGSLELLLTLDALVGAAILRRTNGCSSTARARCAAQPPLSRAHAHTSRGCARQGCGVMRRRAGPASLHPRPTIHGAAPCISRAAMVHNHWSVSCGSQEVPSVTYGWVLRPKMPLAPLDVLAVERFVRTRNYDALFHEEVQRRIFVLILLQRTSEHLLLLCQ